MLYSDVNNDVVTYILLYSDVNDDVLLTYIVLYSDVNGDVLLTYIILYSDVNEQLPTAAGTMNFAVTVRDHYNPLSDIG